MKKLIFCISFIALTQTISLDLQAQNKISYELGNGINFGLNDGAYQFKISGMIQPEVSFQKLSNQQTPDFYYNVNRTYFNFSGSALKEKVSFFLQTDFSLGFPLLDAWIAYKPLKDMTITDRKSTRLNSSHRSLSRMPSSA